MAATVDYHLYEYKSRGCYGRGTRKGWYNLGATPCLRVVSGLTHVGNGTPTLGVLKLSMKHGFPGRVVWRGESTIVQAN